MLENRMDEFESQSLIESCMEDMNKKIDCVNEYATESIDWLTDRVNKYETLKNRIYAFENQSLNVTLMQTLSKRIDYLQEYASNISDRVTKTENKGDDCNNFNRSMCKVDKYESLETRIEKFENDDASIPIFSSTFIVKLNNDGTGIPLAVSSELLNEEKLRLNETCVLKEGFQLDIYRSEKISNIMTNNGEIGIISPELSVALLNESRNYEMGPIRLPTQRFTSISDKSDINGIIVSLPTHAELIDNDECVGKAELLMFLLQVAEDNVSSRKNASRNLSYNREYAIVPVSTTSHSLKISSIDDMNICLLTGGKRLVVNKTEIDDYLKSLLQKAGLIIDFSKCSSNWSEDFLPILKQMIINIRKANSSESLTNLKFIEENNDIRISSIDHLLDVQYEESVRLGEYLRLSLQVHKVNRRSRRPYLCNWSDVKEIEFKSSLTLELTSVPSVTSGDSDIIVSLPARTEIMNMDDSIRMKEFSVFLQTTEDGKTSFRKGIFSDLSNNDGIIQIVQDVLFEPLVDLQEMSSIDEMEISPLTLVNLMDDNGSEMDENETGIDENEPRIDDYLRYLEQGIEEDRSFNEWFTWNLSDYGEIGVIDLLEM